MENGRKIPLDDTNFILRGSSIKNTRYVIGLVCFTGHDTKIMLNSVKARSKSSMVMKKMNVYIMVIFFI